MKIEIYLNMYINLKELMGVKLLSKLLKNECYDETEKIHLSNLFGKKYV